ncbi:MAG: cobalt-precorrin-6A reductase [Salaquimonas sp.]|nr:cobalt-precorrin-6A reductase [Salaquimonas sp.]
MSEIVLILGGTKEAAELAVSLVAEHPDWRVITSLAGRTREPAPLAGETRIGGFGGADGLAEYLRTEGVTRLIDATHPFARQISKNARLATEKAGVPLETVTRPPWQKQPGDLWVEVNSLEKARDELPSGARVLLALGSQHISVFASRADVHFLVRMVDPPAEPLPLADHELVIGKPGNVSEEKALLAAHRISHIVSRNSGGAASYAKIEAARQMGITVVMVERP